MESRSVIRRGKDVLVEIVVIAVAASFVILGLKAVDRLQSARVAVAPKLPSISVGAQLRIATIGFDNSPVSILLISSPTCAYCLASKPFHIKLSSEAHKNRVPFYVAVPQRRAAEEYLRDVGFQQSSIREWDDLNLRANATPTIAVVDSSGFVKAVWVGVLPPVDESILLNVVQTRSTTPVMRSTPSDSIGLQGVSNYSFRDIAKLKTERNISIIDMHERGFPGTRHDAIVMPLIEVRYRAPVELDQDELQVVDCSNLALSECQECVQQLKQAGFQVATLDAGLYKQTCSATDVH